MKSIFTNMLIAAAMVTSVAANADDKGRLFIIGEATPYSWDLDKAQALLSTAETPNVYTGTLYLTSGEGKIFKFMEGTEFGGTEFGLPDNAESTLVNGEVHLAKGTLDEGYKQMSVAADGNYNISVDVENMTANIALAEYQENPVQYTSLFAVGGATPGVWSVNDGTPLYQSATAPYEYSAKIELKAAPESFKIATSLRGGGSFDAKYYYFRDGEDAHKISTDGTDDRQWTVEEAGDYTVTVNTVANSISIEKVTISGIDAIEANPTAAGKTTYFNLQGQKVDNPSNGVFIKVAGREVSKVILR